MKEKSSMKSKNYRKLLFGLTTTLLFTGCSSNNKKVEPTKMNQKKIESSVDDIKLNNTEKLSYEVVRGDIDSGFIVKAKEKKNSLEKKEKTSYKSGARVLSIRDYHGYSIVDALNSIGYDSSFKSRSKLAKKYGIKNYKGTAKQNTKLLKKLKKVNFSNKKNSRSKEKKDNKTKSKKAISIIVPAPIEIVTPTVEPTKSPKPIIFPTVRPKETASPSPTATAIANVTSEPIVTPTGRPIPVETAKPTGTPVVVETAKPTGTPVVVETAKPTGTPVVVETAKPTGTPVPVETAKPTGTPVVVETAKPTGTPTPSPLPSPTITVEPTEAPVPCQHGIYDKIDRTDGDAEYCYHLSYVCNECGETISMDSEANKHNLIEYDNRPHDWYKECNKCFYSIDLPLDSLVEFISKSKMMANPAYWTNSTSSNDFHSCLEKTPKTYKRR